MKSALLASLLIMMAACRNASHESHVSLITTLERAGEAGTATAPQVEPPTAQMTRYPCSRCHEKPLSALKQTKPAAHWEVKLQHAPGVITECKTCHSENRTESLYLMNGKEISFDNSHELCAQCHSRQAADWRGGAHGKRTSGWAEERRVLNCTGCHGSHQPRLSPRWPAMSRIQSEETP